MENNHTLQEKTTAMEKAIRMAKEVHENGPKTQYLPVYNNLDKPQMGNDSAILLATAKQIYDWLTV